MAELDVKEVTTKEELGAITELQWRAYRDPDQPIHHFLHPVLGPTEEDWKRSLKQDQDRLWQERRAKVDCSRWIYIASPETDEVIGAAEWVFYIENPFTNGPQRMEATWWPEGEIRDFVSELVNIIFAPRQNWMQRPFATLNDIAVHPSQRRQGIASKLLDWGRAIADEIGLEILLEATDMGRGLYEKHGYRCVISLAVDVQGNEESDSWAASKSQLGTPTVHIMWRPLLGKDFDDGPRAPWEIKPNAWDLKEEE